jgi:hypothetical protein
MLNDDELIAALSERLRDLASGVRPSEDLIASVDRVIASGGATRQRGVPYRFHRRAFALSFPILAALAAAVLVLAGSGATASFAVTQGARGAILITIRQIAGVAGANARLRQLRVPVKVVPIVTGCPSHLDLTYMAIGTQPETTIRIIPDEIPPNFTVVLGAEQLSTGKIEMAVGRVTSSPPSCAAPGDAGPGITATTLAPARSEKGASVSTQRKQ